MTSLETATEPALGEGAAVIDPTKDTYAELTHAYQFYNERLFDHRLPRVLITLQRKHNSLGYFSSNQFVPAAGTGDFAHEIALNPTWFAIHPIHRTLSILAREMVALDQSLNSEKPPRRRYRNGEWADMCEAIGLMPSDTGRPGGKRTGENVDVYIIDGGRFDQVTTELVDAAFCLSWLDRYAPAEDDPLLQHTPAGPALDRAVAPSVFEQAHHHIESAEQRVDPLMVEDNNVVLSLQEELETSVVAEEGVDGVKAPEVDPAGSSAPVGDDPRHRMKVFTRPPLETLQALGIKHTKTKDSSKAKYCCTEPTCKSNTWGKPSLQLGCLGTEKNPHEMRMMIVEEAAKTAPQDGSPGNEEKGGDRVQAPD